MLESKKIHIFQICLDFPNDKIQQFWLNIDDLKFWVKIDSNVNSYGMNSV